MQIQITGRHIEVTDAIKQFIDKKFARLEKHFDHINSCHVILEVVKGVQKAEAQLHIPNNEIFAHSEDENLYAAIDSLVDKLNRQILKAKDKMKSFTNEKLHERTMIEEDEA